MARFSLARLTSDARAWCKEDRLLWPRVPLVIWGLRELRRIFTHGDSSSVWNGLNLGIHELGHLILAWAPEFIMVAGGSLAQIVAPLFGAWQFVRQRDYFAAAFCFGWLGESLYNLSIYIADARRGELPLVTPFHGNGEVIHDWNYLLDHTGLLAWDLRLSEIVRWTSLGSVTLFLITSFFLLNEIYAAKLARRRQ